MLFRSQEERGFSLMDLGKYGWIPFAAFAAGSLLGGAIPKSLTNRGWTVNRARKTVMIVISCLAPFFCLLIVRADSAVLAMIGLMAFMFGHAAWGNIVIPAEVFPKHVVGTVSGLGGALGGLAGVITQLLVGWSVQYLSFAPVFAVVGSVYLIAFVLVHLLAGELGVIRKDVFGTATKAGA